MTEKHGRRGIGMALALVTLAAVLAGGGGGYALYRVSPAGPRGLAWPWDSGRHSTAATPTPGATASPASAAATMMIQQYQQALDSSQAQPIDAQSGLRLIIPAIGVNAPIVERGVVNGWMVVAPGNNVTHFTYSAYPGAAGNSVLYSHDGTVFRHLDSLAIGAILVVQTPQGTTSFRVRELRIVSPDDLAVLDATSTAVLTLLTCYPYGVDTSRLVVIADKSSS